MNKKIRVIDLVNMKEDEMPRKIKYRDDIFNYQENEKKYKKEDSEAEVWLDWKTEVEILEDNTEEIEELDEYEARKEIFTYTGEGERRNNLYCFSLYTESNIVPKINELVKAVNAIRKEKE